LNYRIKVKSKGLTPLRLWGSRAYAGCVCFSTTSPS